jgi:hypothetical protein
MLTKKLRVVETGKGFTVERRKWFCWENAIFSENKPVYYDTDTEARAAGIKLYSKTIIGEIKE